MAYRLIGRKSGTISFTETTGTVTQETLTRSSKMTSNAIEGGSSIEDHVYLNPEQLQIEGVVVSPCFINRIGRSLICCSAWIW